MVDDKDPIGSLVKIVVGGMKDIASTQVSKAAYDKSYKARIIGVGQIFTDEVSSTEQKEVIERYGIPEKTDDNIANYYSFRLNGNIYCLTSNTDFMLYENVIIRCPNGDFNNMFIESQRSNSETYIPKYLISVGEPENTETQILKESDYWIKVDSDETKNMVAMYQYKRVVNDDDAISYGWVLLYNAGGAASIKLGKGLAFDSEGRICLDVEPQIVIQHAVYTLPTNI